MKFCELNSGTVMDRFLIRVRIFILTFRPDAECDLTGRKLNGDGENAGLIVKNKRRRAAACGTLSCEPERCRAADSDFFC